MDFFEAVEKRGSYRDSFTDQPVPEADLRKILTAGLRAPSGYNFQSTSFVVVTDPGLRRQLAELMPTKATRTAPVILVAVSERITAQAGSSFSPEIEADDSLCFEMEDYAAAVENILLAITALGYAGVWMDGMTRQENKGAAIAKILDIPAGKTVRTIIPLGIPAAPVTQKQKKSLEERVTWR